MSQHVMETCNESDGSWLPLLEYSIKSGVSLSTIRRKIKRNDIPYRLEKGKYFILFDASPEMPKPVSFQAPRPAPELPVRTVVRSPVSEEATSSTVEKSVKMVSDAFEYAIREKDERIRLLEKRNRDLEHSVAELRILVRVLEEKYEVRY